jgi:hypothetical protein
VSERLHPTVEATKKFSDDDLREQADYWSDAGHQNPARASFYLAELRNREFAKRERWMVGLTVAIAAMTLAIGALTAVNAWLVYSVDDSPTHGDDGGKRDR